MEQWLHPCLDPPATTVWAILAPTVGTPSTLTPPCFFGISTARTGAGSRRRGGNDRADSSERRNTEGDDRGSGDHSFGVESRLTSPAQVHPSRRAPWRTTRAWVVE